MMRHLDAYTEEILLERLAKSPANPERPARYQHMSDWEYREHCIFAYKLCRMAFSAMQAEDKPPADE